MMVAFCCVTDAKILCEQHVKVFHYYVYPMYCYFITARC